ncbi:diguanylate cyclase [Pseudomaricurvus alkylphenolicus]|uniref:diguanylate cyclase n=1 Tax=Pseudomaricurvus alkylphenolicus TaxID=1306991 RepID=UPI0014204B2C|nr:diguanylate cyclase [Pseudomaricurvus alkylphenolicus]NIB39971.1 diguanylate cyclase [Pseudomaricurvus alkylphenolicus]
MNQLPIRDLMTRDVLCIEPDASLDRVIELMHTKRRSCIVIVDGRSPVGIITERDMVKILSELLVMCPTRKFTVSDYMSAPPVCINQDASLYEALVITQARRIRHLPVLDAQENIIGILTQGDIAGAHFQAVEQQREIIERQISERTQELIEANEELKALSLQDALMGIGNRRAMEVDIQFTHSNASRYNRPYCMALLDVDFFKKYNDHYGHQAGDEALQEVASCTKASIRSSDRLYRYGGEELLLLLPETLIEDGAMVVERVIGNLQQISVTHEHSPFGKLTLSAGLSAVDAKGGDDHISEWQDAVEAADKRLYRAKEGGRNQLVWIDEVKKLT